MQRGLDSLLTKALGGSAYKRDLWFGDCVLVKSIILVPEADRADSLRRLFLGKLQRVMSDCTIQVGTVEKPASKVHTGRHPVFKNQDML